MQQAANVRSPVSVAQADNGGHCSYPFVLCLTGSCPVPTAYGSSQPFSNKLDQVSYPAGVAPLVVVPRDHLCACPVDDLGKSGIHNTRIRIAAEIDRDQLLRRILQDSLQRTLGGTLEGSFEFFGSRRFLEEGHQINQRDVRRRYAHRITVELALELRQYESDSLCGARRGGNDGKGCGTSAPQIRVRQVEDFLIVRVGMNRSHGAVLDPKILMDNLS